MRYAITRKDGRLMIHIASPLIVRANDGSAVYRRVGSRDRVQLYRLMGDESGQRYSFNPPVDYADWQTDTISGHTIEFPTADQVIAGWPTADEMRALGAKDEEIHAQPRRDDVAAVAVMTEVPTDRTFREAWCCSGSSKIECDMPKARDIHRDRMRRARQPKLDELDRLHNRALGRRRQAEADNIEARRELLRNVTDDPAIEAAQTPDELKAVWPAILETPRP
jgi:hypothetical protein